MEQVLCLITEPLDAKRVACSNLRSSEVGLVTLEEPDPDLVPLKLLNLPQREVSSYWPFVWHPTALLDLLHTYSAHVDNTAHKQIALTATRDVISVCSLTYKRKRNSIHAGVVHLAATHKLKPVLQLTHRLPPYILYIC